MEKSIVEIDVLDLLNVRFTLRGAKIKLSLAAVFFVEEDKKGDDTKIDLSGPGQTHKWIFVCSLKWWREHCNLQIDLPCSSDLTA